MQKISFCERYMLTTAVLKRFKTNTRRLEKALERVVAEYEKQYGEPFEIITQYWDEKRKKVCCLTKHGIIHVGTRYKLGEVVAVAQAYKDTGLFDVYRGPEDTPGWDNKMFVRADLMPHQIQITGVRIERLQDITDEDCMKEGIIRRDDMINSQMEDVVRYTFENSFVGGVYKTYATPREAFAALIERPGIGHKGDWNKNPWAFVYSYKLVK